MVLGIYHPYEPTDPRFDLQQIADTLVSAVKSGSKNAVWQDYQHHFVGDGNRNRFFAELRTLTRRIASAHLVTIGEPEGEQDADLDEVFRWNASLLPLS